MIGFAEKSCCTKPKRKNPGVTLKTILLILPARYRAVNSFLTKFIFGVKVFLFAVVLLWPSEIMAQDELMAISGWHQFKDAPNILYEYLSQQAYDLLQTRKEKIMDVQNLAEWQQIQEQKRKTFLDIVGPFPEKSPLNPRILRTIKKDGYKIENIVFESQPGFYVTSSLFIPDDLEQGEKVPVVIYVSGHAESGYRGDYTRIIVNLVNKGFIVFAYDPVGQGERKIYFDADSGRSVVGRATKEHAFVSAPVFITGSSLARYVIWDGIRAVDYLVTRKEVDPARIGITGRSGGGFQSQYIPVFENRIYATAPENHISNYTRILQSIGPRDGEQNLFHMFANGIDHPDFLIVRAPKPTLMVTTTNDIFNIQGSIETANEVSHIYKAYNEKDNFSMVRDVAGHASTTKNNEEICAFFQKHLNNPGDPSFLPVELPTNEELRVSPTGQVTTSFNSETVYSLNRKESELLIKSLNASRESMDTHLSSVVKMAQKLSGYIEPSGPVYPVLTGVVPREGYLIRKYFIKGDGDYPIPYLLMIPEKSNNKTILYLHPGSKAAEGSKNGEMELFVKNGFTVLAPDMIGTGEVGPGDWQGGSYFPHSFNNNLLYQIWYASILTGRSIVGIRAADVNRLVDVIENTIKPIEIYGFAKNEMCPVLLHAAAFNPSIKRIALIEPLASYRSIVYERFYYPGFIDNTVAGALKHYDLPDLAASLAPRSLLMANITDGTGKQSDSVLIQEDISIIKKTYRRKNAENNLHIINGEVSESLEKFFE